MLRLSGLARAVSLVPTRQARRRGGMGVLKSKNSAAAAATAGRGEGENGEEDDEYFEEDWDDIDDDDDDADAFELGDDWDVKDEDWQADGLPFPTSGGGATRKMEEHVKQKVRIQRAKHSKRRFVDRIRIKATGGHGGNGCSSFFSAYPLVYRLCVS
jgi:hypothetical protein